MARQTGATAQILMKKESTYGTSPSGNYLKIPFISTNLGAEQQLLDDPILGKGRDAQEPELDELVAEGDLELPLDSRNIGQFLTGLLGAATSTDETTHFQHIFKSNLDTLPSYSIEVGMPKVPTFRMLEGCMFNTLNVAFERTGRAKGTVGVVAQGETSNTTTQGGTATEYTFKSFSNPQAAIKRGGSQIGNVVGADFTYSNNVERVATIRNDLKIDGVDLGNATCTGTLDVRFADTTLLDLAIAGTAIDLEFSFEISATEKLILAVNRVRLDRTKAPIQGPGGVEQSFSFRGVYDDTEQAMLTATLLNDLDGTDY